MAKDIRALRTEVNLVPTEHAYRSWTWGRLHGMRVLENKPGKKFDVERAFSEMREVKIFHEPSLFNRCAMNFPQQHVTPPSPYTRVHAHTPSAPGQLLGILLEKYKTAFAFLPLFRDLLQETGRVNMKDLFPLNCECGGVFL